MEEILRMIESVDPSDTAKLDEIDARVYLFVKNGGWMTRDGVAFYGGEPTMKSDYPQYTRDRNALKSIRPALHQWRIYVDYSDLDGGAPSKCEVYISTGTGLYLEFESKWHYTEELAELHAIIQAINHERKESDNERE